jgi:serine/threonine protein phosphatase PrpC
MSAPPSVIPPALSASALSHTGKRRENNEDAFGCFAANRLFVVADGMGGHRAGEVASQMAVVELHAFFRRFHEEPRQPWPHPVERQQSLGANLLRVGMKVANDRIRAAAAADPARNKMACTAVALAIGDAQVSIAHAGDARAYRFRGQQVKRLTRDHSLLAEMLEARPNLSEQELSSFSHRNVVTRALGSKAEVEPTVTTEPFRPGDVYLLCTDGLWGSVKQAVIAEIVRATTSLEGACRALIDTANAAGGPDNITALLVRVDPS